MIKKIETLYLYPIILNLPIMTNNIFSIYFMKLKQSQNYSLVIEQFDYNVFYKSNNWSVKKNRMMDFMLDQDMKEIYLDNEWNYELPINHKYDFMKLNDAEYYKDIYTYYENSVFGFKSFHKYDFPENVKIDYFTFSLNELYANSLNPYNIRFYMVGNPEFWINSFHLVNSLDMHHGNYKEFITKIHNPDEMYQYFRMVEKKHNEKIKSELWKWKKMEDTKQKFKWLMKSIRTKHKINNHVWMQMYSYVF